jgi:hypothetical protein
MEFIMQELITCPACNSSNVYPLMNIKKLCSIVSACLGSIAKFAIKNSGAKAGILVGKKIGSRAPKITSAMGISSSVLDVLSGLFSNETSGKLDRNRYRCRKCKTVFNNMEV